MIDPGEDALDDALMDMSDDEVVDLIVETFDQGHGGENN